MTKQQLLTELANIDARRAAIEQQLADIDAGLLKERGICVCSTPKGTHLDGCGWNLEQEAGKLETAPDYSRFPVLSHPAESSP